MPAHKLDFYLNSSDSLRSLTRAARQIADLQQVLLNSAPPALTRGCRVKQFRDGTLTLLAENAAIAAKLKQLAARLLAAYRKQRSEVTAIRIEVQVGNASPGRAPTPEFKRLSLDAIENLEKLASGLEDSPLKQALTNMATRQRENK